MDETSPYLLAPFAGEKPPAPPWFEAVLAEAPERFTVENEGAAIEYLVWGEAGRPGLLLVHGGAAHCWWWAHIAPFLAADGFRVAAMSLAGMGRSGWRPRYSIEQHARDMRAVADAAGLFAAGQPIIAGHSFGGAPTATVAADPECWARHAIIIDSSLDMAHQPSRDQSKPMERRFHKDLAAGLARFRFLPPQPCENAYVADMLARRSLIEVEGEGWAWSLDPMGFAETDRIDSRAKAKAARCPLVFIYGDRSFIIEPELLEGLKKDLPAGTPFIAIPDSGHHIMVDQPLALVAALRAVLALA